jgi:hypothetical protein
VVSSQWNEVKDEGVNEKWLSFHFEPAADKSGSKAEPVRSPK